MLRNFNYTTFVLALSILLIPTVVHAQAAPLSDYLQLTVTDQKGQDVISPLTFSIAEPVGAHDPGEPPIFFTVPGVTVDFVESTTGGLSDRFHFDPVVVSINSADLQPRAIAKRIPGGALEKFSPLSIFAFSDGNTAGPNATPSDTLRVIQGSYAGTSGAVVFSGVINEPATETLPEMPLAFISPPAFFDLEEPPFETGGASAIISDYVDTDFSQGFFLSSDNPLDYANFPGRPTDIRGKVVEDPIEGGSLQYTLTFVSDVVVPEPASLVLLCIGLLSLTVGYRRSWSQRP